LKDIEVYSDLFCGSNHTYPGKALEIKKAVKYLNDALKTGYCQETSEKGVFEKFSCIESKALQIEYFSDSECTILHKKEVYQDGQCQYAMNPTSSMGGALLDPNTGKRTAKHWRYTAPTTGEACFSNLKFFSDDKCSAESNALASYEKSGINNLKLEDCDSFLKILLHSCSENEFHFVEGSNFGAGCYAATRPTAKHTKFEFTAEKGQIACTKLTLSGSQFYVTADAAGWSESEGAIEPSIGVPINVKLIFNEPDLNAYPLEPLWPRLPLNATPSPSDCEIYDLKMYLDGQCQDEIPMGSEDY